MNFIAFTAIILSQFFVLKCVDITDEQCYQILANSTYLQYGLVPPLPIDLNKTDCMKLKPMCTLKIEELVFKRCYLEYYRDSAQSNVFRKCFSIEESYINDDRYENIIDWVQRGKSKKFYNYGNITSLIMAEAFGALVEENKDYEVVSLDCSGRSIKVVFGLLMVYCLTFILKF